MISISVEGVAKRFGPTEAIVDVSLSVQAGGFLTVLGPSGCGKSTLLRLVNGLIAPDAGRITIGSGTPEQARQAKQFALVPQSPALLPWRSVRRNVELIGEVNKRSERMTAQYPPRHRDVSTPDEVLAAVGLDGFADALPHTLSGGMQQRVALARAFASGASVLLMDEPFAALDEITRAQMRELLLELWARTGTTVLFVTHSISEAVMLSDRVVVMSPRPARVIAEERIELARPRFEAMEDTAEFIAHTARLRQALHRGFEVGGFEVGGFEVGGFEVGGFER
ncbi:MAG: ABC transporter ATP-binding protein [Acidimicrobiia bacterium]